MEVLDLSQTTKGSIGVSEDKKDYAKLFKVYLIPGGGFVTFLILILFFAMPMVSKLVTSYTDLQTLRDKLDQKNLEVNQIVSLKQSLTSLQSDLLIINRIAPDGQTELVEFNTRLSEKASENNLEILSQLTSESSQEDQTTTVITDPNAPVTTVTKPTTLALQEIPVRNFKVRGSLTNVLNFLESIKKLDDFVIIQNFSLIDNDSDDIWEMQIDFTKYQFIAPDNVETLYQNVSPSLTINQKMRAYIDSIK